MLCIGFLYTINEWTAIPVSKSSQMRAGEVWQIWSFAWRLLAPRIPVAFNTLNELTQMYLFYNQTSV
jgi:hypothetical protein